jgi:hypothetical protein
MPEEISRPDQIRQAVAGYVAAAHRAYAAAVPPPGGLLRGDPFDVLAVAAGDLHLIATRQALPAVPAEAAIDGSADGLRWRVRFYDAVLVPGLGRVTSGPDSVDEVRRALGVTSWLYHLVAAPSRMNEHHARHTGLALAGAGASPA